MKEQILAAQRIQDYIETHLDEKIGLSELSQVSMFSPWYSLYYKVVVFTAPLQGLCATL